MRHASRRLLLMVALAAAARCVFAPLSQAEADSLGRTGLWGYDPVSYFTAGHPEPGSAQFSFPFDDTNYWFASEEHRKMFAADPERYAPQFKAYCALSVARGLKVEADPEAWTIWNGKLYVFGTKEALLDFKANPGDIVDKANAGWESLK
jgi:YHS domain-containing protein